MTGDFGDSRMPHVMREFLRRWGPWLKLLLFVLVVVGVSWQFVRILQNETLSTVGDPRTPAQVLWDEITSARPLELVVGAVLYLGGLGFCAFFWLWLLRSLGNPIPTIPGVRGYYISHLGKYAPGKGWALVLRTTTAAAAGARPGMAVLTAVYETLTTMAAGAMVAAVMIAWQGGGDAAMWWRVLALLAVAGIPILPGVFNPIVRHLARKFLKDSSVIPPTLNNKTLVVGLLTTSFSWFLLGASLEAVLHSLDAGSSAGMLDGWLRSTAYVAISYVAGFIASTPGGLGVREWILQQFLAPTLGPKAVVVVLLLRLLWTVAEVVLAALLWWLPSTNQVAGGSSPHGTGAQSGAPTQESQVPVIPYSQGISEQSHESRSAPTETG